MNLSSRLADRLRRIVYFAHNPLTIVGAALTTSSGLILVGFWLIELARDRPMHPYIGLLLFLILPGTFALGLALMPLGVILRRRRLAKAGTLPEAFPLVSWREPALQRLLTLIGLLSLANVAILATASHRGVSYMDSTQFCGTSCHTVMAPEYTTHQDSPHAQVACTECHIGEGAGSFVRAKLSGTRQLFAVAFGTYSRPIPAPVKHLRAARDTCEECHWPRKFLGDRLLVRNKFAEDEANTPATSVLVVKVGGERGSEHSGIHGRHLSDKVRISYVATDDRRQVIPSVRVEEDGRRVDYVSTEIKPSAEALARGERREMDCIDCHNRPTHVFELPERALDRALADGRISPRLPFVKKKALEVLKAEYVDRESARTRIVQELVEYYRREHAPTWEGQRPLVDAAAAQVAGIYERNVFPEMKVSWGVHPDNRGHEDFPGCFRCHDDNHRSADGRVISQDCSTCHAVLAMDETNPKVVEDLGLK